MSNLKLPKLIDNNGQMIESVFLRMTFTLFRNTRIVFLGIFIPHIRIIQYFVRVTSSGNVWGGFHSETNLQSKGIPDWFFYENCTQFKTRSNQNVRTQTLWASHLWWCSAQKNVWLHDNLINLFYTCDKNTSLWCLDRLALLRLFDIR